MSEFTGVVPALVTPFTETGAVDHDSLRTQIAAVAAGGCDGAVLFGYAGEFYKLADDERREIVRAAVDEAAKHDLPMYASVTDQATSLAERRAAEFEACGVDGVMVLPPFVSTPSRQDVYDHVEAVGTAVSVPVTVQYAPDNTGVTVPPATFADLSEALPNVNRYKIECTPTGGYVSALLDAAPDDVAVLVGNGGRQLVEAYDRGAAGVVPGAALHELYVEMHDAYQAGDRDAAMTTHGDLLPLLEATGQTGEMFVHYEKRMQAARDMIETGRCRAPCFTPEAHYDRIFEDLFGPLRERCDAASTPN